MRCTLRKLCNVVSLNDIFRIWHEMLVALRIMGSQNWWHRQKKTDKLKPYLSSFGGSNRSLYSLFGEIQVAHVVRP